MPHNKKINCAPTTPDSPQAAAGYLGIITKA